MNNLSTSDVKAFLAHYNVPMEGPRNTHQVFFAFTRLAGDIVCLSINFSSNILPLRQRMEAVLDLLSVMETISAYTGMHFAPLLVAGSNLPVIYVSSDIVTGWTTLTWDAARQAVRKHYLSRHVTSAEVSVRVAQTNVEHAEESLRLAKARLGELIALRDAVKTEMNIKE